MSICIIYKLSTYARYTVSSWAESIYIEKDNLIYIWSKVHYCVPLKSITAIKVDGIEYDNKYGKLFKKEEINAF